MKFCIVTPHWQSFDINAAGQFKDSLRTSCCPQSLHHPLTQSDPLRLIIGGLLWLNDPTWTQITSSWGSRSTAVTRSQPESHQPSLTQHCSSMSYLHLYSCWRRWRNWRMRSCELLGSENMEVSKYIISMAIYKLLQMTSGNLMMHCNSIAL